MYHALCNNITPFDARWQVGNYFLVLVFAATRSEMALQSVLSNFEGKMAACHVRFESKMSKLLMYKSKSKKVKMNYSSYGRYEGIHKICSLFSLLSF